MAIVMMQSSNEVQTVVNDENEVTKYNIMNGFINNNDKNLLNGVQETSANIIDNQVRNDFLEKSLTDINSDMDANISMTEKDSDDKPKEMQPDNRNNTIESSCDNTLQLNNIAETTHNGPNSLESDNESELINESKSVELYSKKCLRIIDSDSEDEIIISTSKKKVNVIEDNDDTSNESLGTNIVMENTSKTEMVDSDIDNKSQHSEEMPECIKKTRRIFETLVDSESDEDEIQKTESPLKEDTEHINFKEGDEIIKKSKGNQKLSNKKGSIRDSKVEAMKKIHSETQRLIRESQISLPYHRPKSRTLQEFLTRKKVCGMLPKAPTTASKLKISSIIVSKILEDKEKEAEEFYKSSESEEEEENEKIEMRDIENKTPSNGTECVVNDTHNNGEISLESNETSEITNAETEDVSNVNYLCMSNDKIDQIDVNLKGNVQDHTETLDTIIVDHYPNKNNEVDVQKTVDKLLQLVEHETKIDDKNTDEINKDIVFEKVISETHSEETASEVTKEKSQSTENQTSHTETQGNHENIHSSISEKGSEEPEDHVQGLPIPDFIDKEEKSSKKQLLPMIQSNTGPRLRGNPGMIIDLSCDVKSNKPGVESLLNRFFSKHTTSDKDTQKTTEINVIHVEETSGGPKLVKYAFVHKQQILEKEDPELAKPGAKLKRLKEDLKLKMAMKRNEEWKQKEQELKEQEDQLEEDELYDVCNEEKLCDDTSESGESEPEENDIPMLDKRNKPACDFVDDEAMESEDEEEEENEEEEEENEEEEEENEEEEEERQEKNSLNDNDHNESSNESIAIKKKWKPSRIIKAFDDDSNSSLSNLSIDKISEVKKKVLERTSTDIDLFHSDWNSDEECNMLIFEKNKQIDTVTQACKTPSVKTNVLDFVSPITQLTILNTNLDSDTKDSAKKNESIFAGSIDSFSQMDTPFGKICRSTATPDKRIGLQKKLFDDFNGVTNDEDLMQLCSGAFPSTQNDFNPITSSRQTSSVDSFNTQMLDMNKLGKDIILDNETSQDMKLYLDDNSISSLTNKTQTKENSSPDAPWSNLFAVVPSDDDDESRSTNEVNLPRKRHVKKLELSDDEDESANNLQSDEEEEEKEEEEEEYLDYDSEENEVVVSKKSIKKVTSEFFENEAELSESDWDSADEDEKDLDKLEREEGDEDDIDENKVRNQLEKIHMRQVLDQDQREVRMLQELLFEDGDLHTEGSGRQRKFKWKNIDKLGENEAPIVDDDANAGVDVQENENELAWYKLRYERDKFVEEKRRADVDLEIEEDLEKSEIFKFGVKILKRIESGQSDKDDSSQNYDKSIEPIMPRNLSDLLKTPSSGGNENTRRTIMKKRSFLSRGEHELERIAKRVKLNDTVNFAQVNTKNFVFAHVSPVVKNDDIEENENMNREEENESKDKASRRKRKTTMGMTPTTAKRIKKEGTDTKKKKLF